MSTSHPNALSFHLQAHYSSTDTSTTQIVLLPAKTLDQLPANLSSLTQQYVSSYMASAGFKADIGECLPLFNIPDAPHSQLLIVGLGDITAFSNKEAQTLAQSIYKAIGQRCTCAVINTEEIPDHGFEVFLLALANSAYTFDAYKSKPKTYTLKEIVLLSSNINTLQPRFDFALAVHTGQTLARNLANEPANVCFPEYMADQARVLADEFPNTLKVTVLEEAQMAALGMHSFLAVSKGSERAGRLITLEYMGAADDSNPVVLVGKGVTFDTGGISIKPAAGMEEMKFDMSGAASVLGVMRALCTSKLPINVVGALACAENMPSGRASRPGDVVTSMSGQTIEINNTDAEGRLVLCDTLTYIKKFNPDVVIDIATLTGACIVALGKVLSGLFSPDQALANELLSAGQSIHDRVWQMPVLEDYQELIDSAVADMANTGGPTAGSVTAACFLARYTKDYRWAHLDIAGTSHISGANKCATGRPVPLLMQFLKQRLTK